MIPRGVEKKMVVVVPTNMEDELNMDIYIHREEDRHKNTKSGYFNKKSFPRYFSRTSGSAARLAEVPDLRILPL